MSVNTIMAATVGQALRAQTDWYAVSKGFFRVQAPDGTALPYTTYMIESELPVQAMRSTAGYRYRFQIKHWAEDAAGVSGYEQAANMAGYAALALHARDDDGYGTSCAEAMARLNALTELGGWNFRNAEIVMGLPTMMDTIGSKQVHMVGHKFEFWIEHQLSD